MNNFDKLPTHMIANYRSMLPVDISEELPRTRDPFPLRESRSTMGRWIEFSAGRRVVLRTGPLSGQYGVMVKRASAGRFEIALDSGKAVKVPPWGLLLA